MRAIERCDVTLPWQQNFWITTIRSLSNDAGDGKEKWKKVTGLHQQNNNCARASRFFVPFLAVITPLRRETSRFHAPALRSRRAQRKNCLFLFLNLDTVLSDLTPENFANIWQIEWNWIRSSKFEKARIHFLSDVFCLLSSRNLLPWQRDVTTSRLYCFTIGFGSIKSYTNLLNILGGTNQL